jgi:hypothetical protein
MSNQTPDQRPEDQQSLGGDNLSELPPFEGRPIKPASFPAHRRTIASIGNPGPNSAARSARRGAGVVEARSAESRFSVSCGQSQRTGITGTSPGSLLPTPAHLPASLGDRSGTLAATKEAGIRSVPTTTKRAWTARRSDQSRPVPAVDDDRSDVLETPDELKFSIDRTA